MLMSIERAMWNNFAWPTRGGRESAIISRVAGYREKQGHGRSIAVHQRKPVAATNHRCYCSPFKHGLLSHCLGLWLSQGWYGIHKPWSSVPSHGMRGNSCFLTYSLSESRIWNGRCLARAGLFFLGLAVLETSRASKHWASCSLVECLVDASEALTKTDLQ